ncbi:MAG: 50S ribosomal protein L6 [Verrucomicrobiota bacterium]
MSRIGKKAIQVPDKAKIRVEDRMIFVEGPKGKLEWEMPAVINAKFEDGKISVSRESENRQDKALHGLSRALISNMVTGATEGFTKKLEIQGVGFRAALKGKVLNLNLGFSHPIDYEIPEDVKVSVNNNTEILVEGIDKQRVGAVAAKIRDFYPPEPYKGKGVRYADEIVRRKEGKTAQGK